MIPLIRYHEGDSNGCSEGQAVDQDPIPNVFPFDHRFATRREWAIAVGARQEGNIFYLDSLRINGEIKTIRVEGETVDQLRGAKRPKAHQGRRGEAATDEDRPPTDEGGLRA